MSFVALSYLKKNLEEFEKNEDRVLIEEKFKKASIGLSITTSLIFTFGYLGYAGIKQYASLYKNTSIANLKLNTGLAWTLSAIGMLKLASMNCNRNLRDIYDEISEKDSKILRNCEKLIHENNYRAMKDLFEDC